MGGGMREITDYFAAFGVRGLGCVDPSRTPQELLGGDYRTERAPHSVWMDRMTRAGIGLVFLCATALARAEAAPVRVFAQRADGSWLSAAQDHVALSRELPNAHA